MTKKGLFGSKKGFFGDKTPMGSMLKMMGAKKRTNGIMGFTAIKRSFRNPWSIKRRMERRPNYYSESMKFLRILPRRVFAR